MTMPAMPMMQQRLWRHFITERSAVNRAFSMEGLRRIETAIAEGERRHAGQLCVAIEAALPLARVWQGATPRERALEVFSLLRVWDTEHNDGVLLYLLLADKDVEIVADRGIHAHVGAEAWEAICKTMEGAFGAGRYAEGVEAGIAAITSLLAVHAPGAGGRNELSDRPVIL